jgi:hypothetical protein
MGRYPLTREVGGSLEQRLRRQRCRSHEEQQDQESSHVWFSRLGGELDLGH